MAISGDMFDIGEAKVGISDVLEILSGAITRL